MKFKTYHFILPLFIIFTTSCASVSPNKSTYPDGSSTISDNRYNVSSRFPSTKEKHIIKNSHTLNHARKIEKSSIETGDFDLTDESPQETEIDSISNGHLIDTALDLCETAQEYWEKGELENALDALDQAYELIIKVDTYDKPVLTQQKDDLRFAISKRILEIYASRNIVVNGNYNEIPLTINEHVQQEIDLFTTGRERNFFIESYKRSGYYRPMIIEALKNAGLPEDLSWLPLIESGFKVNALSSARALGLWQFIPSTGYKFGLKRDLHVDERLDFEKSTEAAIAYMKELHQIFGDWATVLAAYNCGEGRVLRVIRAQNVNYLDNFWDLYTRLPRETARYVPRFLATLHVINNLDKYGMDNIEPYPPLDFETVTINCEAHVNAVAKAIDISENTLKGLNPELRKNILPSDEYTLRVPVGKSELLLAKIDEIPIYTPPPMAPAPKNTSITTKTSVIQHKVKKGETLSTIAKSYGVNATYIADANRLKKKGLIVVGQTLKIPGATVTGSSNSSTLKKSSSKQITNHVVGPGDSLWVLARKYGTTTEKIKEQNRLTNSTLYIGQALKIATPSQSVASSSKANKLSKYKVTRGDTPFSIAQRHNMSVQRFLELNRLHTNSKIYPGQSYFVE